MLRLAMFLGAATVIVQAQFPVMEAVQKGHAVGREQAGIDAVTATLARGGNVNERDKHGWTPLMYACLECRAAIVDLLIERGADAKLRASAAGTTSFLDHGQTALHVGASCFIARRRAGLAPERGMPVAYAQMELAAARKIVQRLIRAGADVNATDIHGRTPLMMAAMHGWPEASSELLAAQANVRALDGERRLAIDYADPADAETISLLRRAGSPTATGRSGRAVCDAERALDQRGYKTPIIDCIAGDQLRTVITKFQQDQRLPPTGELDAPTRKALAIR